jgi:hypothetical protein
MQSARRSDRVTYHNIIGIKPSRSGLPWNDSPPLSDGVVSIESARSPDASSEIEVPAEHSVIHQHPLAILEIRRILLEHMNEVHSRENFANDADPATDTVPSVGNRRWESATWK